MSRPVNKKQNRPEQGQQAAHLHLRPVPPREERIFGPEELVEPTSQSVHKESERAERTGGHIRRGTTDVPPLWIEGRLSYPGKSTGSVVCRTKQRKFSSKRF